MRAEILREKKGSVGERERETSAAEKEKRKGNGGEGHFEYFKIKRSVKRKMTITKRKCLIRILCKTKTHMALVSHVSHKAQ